MQYSFNSLVAQVYGVDGAIMLENLYFWIRKNEVNGKHFHDGTYWTYNSAKAFSKLFSFWNERQIERILRNLERDGAIITGSYNESGYDHTKWYALTENTEDYFDISEQSPCIIDKKKFLYQDDDEPMNEEVVGRLI